MCCLEICWVWSWSRLVVGAEGRTLRARELVVRPLTWSWQTEGWLGWNGGGISEISVYDNSGYVAVSVQGKALMEVEDSLFPEFAQSLWTPFCWNYYEVIEWRRKGPHNPAFLLEPHCCMTFEDSWRRSIQEMYQMESLPSLFFFIDAMSPWFKKKLLNLQLVTHKEREMHMIEVECPLDQKFHEGRASVAPEPNSRVKREMLSTYLLSGWDGG